MKRWRRRVLEARLQTALAGLLLLGACTSVLAAELVDDAQKNDTQAVIADLAHGSDVNTRAGDGTTALHWAVYNGNVGLVDRLVAAGANVNAKNIYGATPLRQAAVTGDAAVVKTLLDAGAAVDEPGPDGETALMVAARGNGVEAAKLLIEHGANVNAHEQWKGQTALIYAAAESQPEMIKLLLEHGANPNAQSKPNVWQRQVSAERRRMYRPIGGLTALMYAARQGCVECARALVEGGADPDLSNPRNVVPLIVALENFHFDLAAYLVKAGATLDIWDWWGRSPLYVAVDMDTIPRGGRPDRRSTDKTTALDVVKQILEAGANPNLQLKLTPPYRARPQDRGCDGMLTTGATALLRAAKTFDVPAMKVLLAHGARWNLPNDAGVTPVMAAAGYGSVECDIRVYGNHYMSGDVQAKSIAALQVLLDAGADINARTTGGRRGHGPGQTALFGAAFWGWDDVVKYLAEHGAKIDAKDEKGRTALDAALGRAGGHGRGQSIMVFDETAKTLKTLCSASRDCDVSVLAGSTS